jgi:hypothetical protein
VTKQEDSGQRRKKAKTEFNPIFLAARDGNKILLLMTTTTITTPLIYYFKSRIHKIAAVTAEPRIHTQTFSRLSPRHSIYQLAAIPVVYIGKMPVEGGRKCHFDGGSESVLYIADV